MLGGGAGRGTVLVEWMRGNVRMDDSGSEGVKVELEAWLEAAPRPIVLHSM